MAFIKPMLELSKKWMDPTGGEIIDEWISGIPMFADAVNNNDMVTIQRTLSDTKKSMELLLPHIAQPELRNVFAERLVAFKSLVTCMDQGKCGLRAYIHHLVGCINPGKALFRSLMI